MSEHRIIGIDPGPDFSAYCKLIDGKIGKHEYVPNWVLRDLLYGDLGSDGDMVLECPQAQNRPLGPLLRNTIWAAARFAEIIETSGVPYIEADEIDVRCYIAGSRTSSNSDLLNSLKGIFGDKNQTACVTCQSTGSVDGKRGPKKCPACRGNKFLTQPGPLSKLNEHERSALAAAWWYWQRLQEKRATA